MATELEKAGVEPWLAEAIERIVRGEPSAVEAVLTSVCDPRRIDETATRCRLHFLTRDGNGFPRAEALAEMLAEQVMDYCIPRSRIEEALENQRRTKSTDMIVRLGKEAKELFVRQRHPEKAESCSSTCCLRGFSEFPNSSARCP